MFHDDETILRGTSTLQDFFETTLCGTASQYGNTYAIWYHLKLIRRWLLLLFKKLKLSINQLVYLPTRIAARDTLWLLTFFGFGVNYMLRININIAIVDMVKHRNVNQDIQATQCYSQNETIESESANNGSEISATYVSFIENYLEST